MKKVAIVYTSKFGHTKQYADWLAAHLGKDDADVINVAGFNPTQILAYKLVIYASCVYGDKMPIMDFIKKNIAGVSPAKTMFMAVGWYTNDSEEAVQKLMEENYPDQFKGKVPLFVVNSGIDKKKISVGDKAKLLASQVMIEKKDGRSNDDINILAILKGYSDPTAEENLNSIKKGIEDFFDPKKSDAAKDLPPLKADRPAPAPRPAVAPVPVVESKSEPKPAPKPEPKSEPAPKPMAASEMTSDADALSSLENAFKALKAPKPAAEVKPEPKPEPVPKPMAASEMTSDADALSSLENAFKALNAPKSSPVVEVKPEPKPEPVVEVKPEPKPEPVVEVKPEPKPEPVVEVKPVPKPAPKVTPAQAEVASSVKSAIRAMSNGSMNTNYAPAPAFEDIKSEDVSSIGSFDMNIDSSEKLDVVKENIIPTIGEIDLSAEAGMSWDSVTSPKSEAKAEPIAEVKPEPIPEPEPSVSTEAPKNSYMELFAKRRRKAVEEPEAVASPVVEAKLEPEVEAKPEFTPEPVVESKPELKPEPVAEIKSEPVKPVAIEKPSVVEHAAAVDVLSEFDFLSTATAPVEPVKPVSAVDTTAAVDMDVYDFMDDSKPKASSRALNAVQDLAKAKAEAEKEAAKKAAEEAAAKAAEEKAAAEEVAISNSSVDNSFIEKMKMDMAALAEESQHEIEQENSSSSEEIDGLTFSNELDYDLGAIEIDTPPIGEVSLETIHTFDDFSPKESSPDFDLKKLQEEINASIESNKVNKEKMLNRYGKKQKTEVHNPFAVQFEEDESKSKKKKKENEIGSKRLDDPLDPDIFFSRPKKNADLMMPSDTMPEIKFRKR